MNTNCLHPERSRTLAFLYLFIGGIAAWTLLMPWVPAITRASMRRFHLVTPSFALWAIAQPMPSMYSFANTFDVRTSAPVDYEMMVVDTAYAGVRHPDCLHREYVNHYPSQVVTFGEVRLGLCRPGEPRWVVTSSTYRGQRLIVVTEVTPAVDRFEVRRRELDMP